MTTRTNGTATLTRTPRLILGPAGLDLPTAALRDLGWHLTRAATGEEARRLALKLRASTVVLSASSAVGESGLLTCAKLVRALPKVRVVLVGPADEETERFALFAGAAAYVPADAPPAVLLRAVTG